MFISGYANTGKKFSIAYKINFPRKHAKLFVWHWLKEKSSPVAKPCPRSLAHAISSCFAKRCSRKYGLFSLKMSAYTKKNWHTFFVTIFQVSADEGMGK